MFVPVTHYVYDDQGRLSASWTDPLFDDYDRALVDAYKDHLADLHTCGRPMSESLRVIGRPDPEYRRAVRECVACEALERSRAAQHKREEQQIQETGVNPAAWQLDHLELIT